MRYCLLQIEIYQSIRTKVGFSVKAVNVETGVILWKGSHTKTTKLKYNYDPGAYANEVAREIVQELIKRH